MGRDTLARLIVGARIALSVSLGAVSLGVLLGVPLNLLSVYSGPGRRHAHAGGLLRLRVGDWRAIIRDGDRLEVLHVATLGSAYRSEP